jgi:hypothetical protein
MKKLLAFGVAAAALSSPFSASAIYVEGQDPVPDDGLMHIMSDVGTTDQDEFMAQDVCEEIGGDYIVHMVVTPLGGAACMLGDREVSLESLQDKYNTYVKGMMINYASEWKYSDEKIWDNYLEFAQHDIDDTKAFREMDISDEAKARIDKKLPVMEDLYEFMRLEDALGAKNVKTLTDALVAYESKFTDAQRPAVYAKLEAKLEKRISGIEYEMMVSHYTPEGNRKITLKLNAYKYLLILVQGRME